jgi:hypothetical protein
MSIPAIAYVSLASNVGPVYLGVKTFRRLNRPMKIFLFLCSAIFIQFLIELTYALLRRNNHEITNLGNVMEAAVICAVYFTAVKEKNYRTVFLTMVGLFFIFLLIGVMLYHVPDRIDPVAASLGKIAIISCGFIYLFHELKFSASPISLNPIVWFAVGSLIYNVGTIFIFALSTVLLKMGDTVFIMAWNINFLLIIAANIIYMKGFLCTTP